MERRSIQLFIVISGIISVSSPALYTLLSVRLRSRSQPSNSQEHVNKTCLIFLGESASEHRHSIPGCHTKLSVSVDTQSGNHARAPSSSLDGKGRCQTFCWQVKLHTLSGQNKPLRLFILHTSIMGSQRL